jgi:hypothetical protein
MWVSKGKLYILKDVWLFERQITVLSHLSEFLFNLCNLALFDNFMV